MAVLPATAETPVTNVTGTVANAALTKKIHDVLRVADEKMQHQDWSAASAVLNEGLEAIGSRYQRAGLLDDSGIQLITAEVEERKGNQQLAAQLRRVVLRDRLDWLLQKPAGER